MAGPSDMAASKNRSKRAGRWGVILVAGLGLGVLGYRASGASWFGEDTAPRLEGVQVRRGPLLISILARGDLAASDSIDLKSEVEGKTTILSLVPEGTRVEAGQVVCELDATPLIEKRFQQTITVSNAEAAHVKSKQNYAIQQSQNRSDIAMANQKLAFAEQDLQKFLQGERDSELETSKQAIDLAKEDAARAEGKYVWSQKLAEKGFLTSSELEADRIANHRASVVLLQAQRDLDLLERFQLPRQEAELRAAREEAEFECERVELQAKARIVDYEADVSTNEAKLGLEREKLSKLEIQIDKARIRAPRAGLLVYAQLDSDEPPIQEGTDVRERQTIASIPNAAGMKAQAKLHESVLKQVRLGLPCNVTVEAIPGKKFHGTVAFVAVLPDQNARWSNPNLRQYRTDIAIESVSIEMRPGMSCSIEIRVEELEDVLFVPVQSVFPKPGGTVCFVSTPTGIEARRVRVGSYNVENVQILDGLVEGETVLLSPPPEYEASEPEEPKDAPEAETQASAPGEAKD